MAAARRHGGVDSGPLLGAARWADWRRGVDFYPESELIWLEADTVIREKSGGRSRSTTSQAFHGAPGSGPMVKTYRFEDVVAALGAVVPYDWAGFFRTRVSDVAPRAPLGGIENGGWKLVYNDVQPELTRAGEEESRLYDFWFSLGIAVEGGGRDSESDSEDGVIRDVVPDRPAAAAGIAPGMRLVAVNGRRYSARILREALAAARSGGGPIELLVENIDEFRTYPVKYDGGERFPHLQKDSSKTDWVSAIGRPSTPEKP